MKTSATIVIIVALLLLGSFPAGANVFKDLASISIIRERSAEFGYDVNGYSNDEIRDFLRTIPRGELEAFQESYARRPNSGTTMTAELEVINRIEFVREKNLLHKWLSAWEKNRPKNPPAQRPRREPADSFALNN